MLWLCVRIALDFAALAMVRRVRGAEVARRREAGVYARQGARIRRVALGLQGLIIKVGQFLSTRADLLPEAFTRELTPLQDIVSPLPWEAVAARLEEAYGRRPEEVFGAIEREPLAAASLAQVHAARLPDGREVAVKVLRPGIEGLVRTDLASLRFAARWAQRHTAWGRRFDLLAVHAEFAATSRAELDMVAEGERAARFRANFAGSPWVRAPEVYPEWTRPTVLVMERVGGLRIDDTAALRAAGVDPGRLARRLLRSFMQQLLRDGFYHADPHPGNLFVQPDGALTYVDFGMMGSLAAGDRAALRLFFRGVLQRDVDLVTQAAIDLGFVRPGTDRVLLRRAMAFAVDRILGLEHRPPGEEGFHAFGEEMREFLYSHPFQLQARYTMLGRGFGMLAGIVERLLPAGGGGSEGGDGSDGFFRLLVDAALRYLDAGAAQGLLGAARVSRTGPDGAGRPSLEGLASSLLGAAGPEVVGMLRDTLTAPAHLDRTLQALARGDWQLPVDWAPLLREVRRQGERARALGWAIWGGALLLAGASLRGTPGGRGLGDGLWALAAVCLVAFIAGGRARRRPPTGPAD